MGQFKTFSLSEAVTGGQKMAANQMALQDAATSRNKASKSAVLRQRMVEGDTEAFAELAGLDIDQAKKTMDAVKTMEDNQIEAFKQQNDALAKASVWVMQGQNEQEQKTRFDQAVEHMENQGLDMSKYKGNYSPQLMQNTLMQSRTIDQMIESTRQKGVNKGVDAQGKPVFFSTGAVSGEPQVMKGVRPSDYQVHGKKTGGTGAGTGKGRKAADSNAIAKRVGEHLGATWVKDPDSGALSFTFKSDEDARKAAEIGAIAEKIYSANPSLLHSQATQEAIKEYEAQSGEGKPALKDRPKTGGSDTLKGIRDFTKGG